MNFGKPDSQYGSGMKPVLYSEKEAGLTGVGWQRAGHGMRYYKREEATEEERKLWAESEEGGR